VIAKRLTQFAESSAMRYAAMCDLWQSAFDAGLNDKHFGYADHAGNVAKSCLDAAESYLADEREHIDRIIEEIALDARTATLRQLSSNDSAELPDALLDHLSMTATYIADELIAQIHRDVAMVRQAIQRVQLDVYTTARAKGMPERQALIEYRISNSEHLDFLFHDRYARKWASKKFIRALWRASLLGVYNETVMITLADHGVTTAGIFEREQGKEVQIATISLIGEVNGQTYADVRIEHFHPNSPCYLAMETPDV
jgi:hypothetical protein